MEKKAKRRLVLIGSQAISLLNFKGYLIRDLIKADIEVYAFAPDYDDVTRDTIRSLGAEPIDYDLQRTGMNPFMDFVSCLKLRRILIKVKADICLSYFVKPVIYGSISAHFAGVTRIYSMIEGLGYVFTTEGVPVTIKRRLLKNIVAAMYRFALKLNKRVFLLNDDDIAVFISMHIVDKSRIVHIPGIGLDLSYYVREPPVIEPISFIFVARMLKEKGTVEFIEAAKAVSSERSKACFLMLGGIEEREGGISAEQIRALIAGSAIEWLGQVADVRPYIRKASVFVLPSYREGLPRSTQEAMAMGRPVITSDVPGCRETVVEGVNGFLVPPRDVSALKTAMLRFVDEPSLIGKMGAESRRLCEEKFNVIKINREILRVMEI
jgi:glycosyltransferase involved in cell wall biosynthesis